MDKQEIKYDETKNVEYNLPCSNCSGETVHKVLSSANVVGEFTQGTFWIKCWEDYEIIQCQGCKLVSFRKNNRNTENTFIFRNETGDYEEDLSDNIELFPSRILGRQKLQQAVIIPYKVRQIYEETHSAMSNSLFILTAIGIRALIEAVCKEKSATGRNLQDKIDKLKNLGILTNDGAEILHSIRLLGNVAAHEVEPPTADMINAAFEIVESLLNNVYIIPEIAKRLK